MNSEVERELRAEYGFLVSPAVASDPRRPPAELAASGANTAADWEEHVEALLLNAAAEKKAAKASDVGSPSVMELARLAAMFPAVARMSRGCAAVRRAAFDRVADAVAQGGEPSATLAGARAVVLPPRSLPDGN
uniref:Uncharacterized protein n=1 Tax=Neobodo designis TaxID=312471 RepID=A0A7S1LNX0_NEODS|mmetsp:Transcript_25750/g.79437  ORF Transcript_25750/g.79437 Transcript_25750/m.79437 type:complete len:134 (+) Transcript_25750:43-444(+)